jgi:hypothetical protein
MYCLLKTQRECKIISGAKTGTLLKKGFHKIKDIVKFWIFLWLPVKQGFCESFDESFFWRALTVIFVSNPDKVRGNTANTF